MMTNKDELKMKMSSKVVAPPKNNLAPLLLQYYLNFLETSHLDSHTTNDVKPDMLSGVQAGNRIPNDECNVCGIAHVRTYIKDNILAQSFKCRRK